MSKIKLTKNEVKKQKDSLKRYKRYLPTLQLKKQQLQMEVRKIEEALEAKKTGYAGIVRDMESWAGVLCENVGLEQWVKIKEIKTGIENVAGVDIPTFLGVEFEADSYDLFLIPLWVDRAIKDLRKALQQKAQIAVLERQAFLIREELRTTSQRVNLFEKVKIPESSENIRVIQIYLGDQQTAGVVRGKISKRKLVGKEAL